MPSPSEADRRKILTFARQVVVEAVTLGRLPEHVPTDGIFGERRGVFVTLRNNGRLRGCIGVVEAETPLGDSVARCAAGAALQDPRFAPMRVTDLNHLQIEISLLSQPEPIGINAIEIGRHGLIVVSGERRGLLLPQVAIEHQFGSRTIPQRNLPQSTPLARRLARCENADSWLHLRGFLRRRLRCRTSARRRGFTPRYRRKQKPARCSIARA